MRKLIASALAIILFSPALVLAQRYTDSDGRLRVPFAKQPFSAGISAGPNTIANGGIQQVLVGIGAIVRNDEAVLTPDQATEYGAWKRPVTLETPTTQTRADILRGEYGRYRANNDLLYYHLDVRVDPDKKFLGGRIRFGSGC